jgi:hypothetical protein
MPSFGAIGPAEPAFGIFLFGATSCNLGSKVVEDSFDGLEIRLLGLRGHAEEDLFLDVGEEQGYVGAMSTERLKGGGVDEVDILSCLYPLPFF